MARLCPSDTQMREGRICAKYVVAKKGTQPSGEHDPKATQVRTHAVPILMRHSSTVKEAAQRHKNKIKQKLRSDQKQHTHTKKKKKWSDQMIKRENVNVYLHKKS